MTSGKTGEIRREIFIEATPATVYAFLTQPDRMRMWMGVEHTFDPRPGGVYRVNVTGRDIAVGEFRELIPNRRVSYTWGWQSGGSIPPGSSLVEIDLEAVDGGTRLTFVHSGLPDAAMAPHEHGWDHYLERFAAAASGRDAGADPWIKQAGAAEPDAVSA